MKLEFHFQTNWRIYNNYLRPSKSWCQKFFLFQIGYTKHHNVKRLTKWKFNIQFCCWGIYCNESPTMNPLLAVSCQWILFVCTMTSITWLFLFRLRKVITKLRMTRLIQVTFCSKVTFLREIWCGRRTLEMPLRFYK